MKTLLNKINNFKISTKFLGAMCLILLVMTFLDITYNARKEKNLAHESLMNWSNLMGETVRVSLNTLMREGKMDVRFALFESLSTELTALRDVRVIRGKRTDEIFLEANRKDFIPRWEKAKERILQNVENSRKALGETEDKDEKESLREEIDQAAKDLNVLDMKIEEAGKIKKIDPREAPRDELDREVLEKGDSIFRFEGDNARVVIPYKARRESCSQNSGCHTYAREGDVLGAISMEFSIAAVNEEIRQNNLKMAGFWSMRFAIFIAVISVLLALIVTRNLKSMLLTFREMARGDLSVRAEVKWNDEIGELALGFNEMADKLARTTVSKEYVDNIVRNMMDILIIVSNEGHIVRINNAACEILAYEEEEILGTPLENIFTLHDEQWEDLLATGKLANLEISCFGRNEKIIPALLSASLMYDGQGEMDGVICVAKDLTEQKESVEMVRQLTSYDDLTGLINRRFLVNIINDCLQRSKGEEKRGALLVIDIDDFLVINDTYGHQLGDDFLKHFANLLKGSVGSFFGVKKKKEFKHFSIARLGADEFAVLLPGFNEKDAHDFAEKIRMTVESFRYPFFSESSKETVSIGIAHYPEQAKTASDLLSRADTAMHRAKEEGGNRVHLFSVDDGDHKVFHARRELKEQIHKAIEEDRLEPWLQPILDLKTGMISHYEALVRMRNEDGSLVMPANFIEAAERYKLISAIDMVMAEKAMRVQAESAANGRHLSISINLSGKDLDNTDFLAFLKEKIMQTGASAENLIFEITETEAVRDMGKAKEFISSLKATGCKISLDDFGVGFTSFLYLREMQVDYIKIDGTFIKRLDTSTHDQLFVKAITDVAGGMGIKVVAEFVETEEVLHMLKKLGVDYGQGYLIGKPSPRLLEAQYQA